MLSALEVGNEKSDTLTMPAELANMGVETGVDSCSVSPMSKDTEVVGGTLEDPRRLVSTGNTADSAGLEDGIEGNGSVARSVTDVSALVTSTPTDAVGNEKSDTLTMPAELANMGVETGVDSCSVSPMSKDTEVVGGTLEDPRRLVSTGNTADSAGLEDGIEVNGSVARSVTDVSALVRSTPTDAVGNEKSDTLTMPAELANMGVETGVDSCSVSPMSKDTEVVGGTLEDPRMLVSTGNTADSAGLEDGIKVNGSVARSVTDVSTLVTSTPTDADAAEVSKAELAMTDGNGVSGSSSTKELV